MTNEYFNKLEGPLKRPEENIGINYIEDLPKTIYPLVYLKAPPDNYHCDFGLQKYETYPIKSIMLSALKNWRSGKTVVIGIGGEPDSGKSQLASEIIRPILIYLIINGFSKEEIQKSIIYTGFEDVQKAAAALNLIPENHPPGDQTSKDYRIVNQMLTRSLVSAINPGRISINGIEGLDDRPKMIITEAPDMAKRGESVFNILALKQDAFRPRNISDSPSDKVKVFDLLDFQTYFIEIVSDQTVHYKGLKQRRQFKDKEPDQVLNESGNVVIRLEDAYPGNIGGGDIFSYTAFQRELREDLYNQQKTLLRLYSRYPRADIDIKFLSQIKSPDSFLDNDLRMRFEAQYLFPKKLAKRTSEINACVVYNPYGNEPHFLFQGHINFCNFLYNATKNNKDIEYLRPV